MSISRLLNLLRTPAIGALLGVLFFFAVFRAEILNPAYIDWQVQEDPGQHYLGWLFFRYEPWQFPLGKIAGYGAPEGSSVVFTDSIPWLAFSFKLIRHWLPEPFQYTGLWILFCYVMQGVWGWLLASLTTRDWASRALISCFFIVSPSMLDRSGGHHSLMGHWLLLMALYMGLQSKQMFESRHRQFSWHVAWLATLLIGALVHLYLLAMIMLIYTGAIVSFLHGCRWRGLRNFVAAAAPVPCVLLTLLIEGAFVVAPDNWAAPSHFFGHFSMNLLSPVIPGHDGNAADTAYVSYFLPSLKWADGGQVFEGFNYLGLGVLLMVVTALCANVLAAVRRVAHGAPVCWPRAIRFFVPWPVIVAALALSLFSLSNVVVAGSTQLAYWELGGKLRNAAEIFRSSGRFFWPVGYLILIWAIHAVSTSLSARPAFLGLLGFCLAIQTLDLSQFFRHHSIPFQCTHRYESPLKSPIWSELVRHYKHIEYYPQSDSSYYIPFGLLAAPQDATINVAYKARSNGDGRGESSRAGLDELRRGELRPDVLYVFRDQRLFDSLDTKEDIRLRKCVDDFFVAGTRAVGE